MRHSYRYLGGNGRLGNQLFQIAGTIGRAARAGDRANAVFPPWAYAHYFSVPPHHFIADSPDERTIDAGRAYLQNLAEFEGCVDYIRQIFTPSTSAVSELHSLTSSRELHPHTTAVHVRRGDYLVNPFVVTVCPEHYFTRAMADMRRRHPGTHFNIYSDDVQWCIDNLSGPDDVTVVVPPPVANPMQAEMADFNDMRRCDAFVISNSTFSWWAAFLSESSSVICPDQWMGPSAQVHIDDIIPPEWTRRSIAPIGPFRTPLLMVSEGETGYIVTDNRTSRVHQLNATSTLIFELSNGSNTVDDIARVMDALVPVDVWTAGLEQLVTLGLVTIPA